MDGLVLIDKPPGLTSHDVVNRWRRIARTRRAGHLGTLDPMATGLLMIVTGSATRLAPFYASADKTYEARIALGRESDTFDAEGRVIEHSVSRWPDRDLVEQALSAFRGSFEQTPPPVSAKKVGGIPAYKLARRKQPVVLKPVPVEVKELALTDWTERVLELQVRCTAGTYVRSIAHDLGVNLGCGALLEKLRRTQAGEFQVEAAHSLETLEEMAVQGRLPQAVISPAEMLPSFPAEHLEAAVEREIRHGRRFRTSPFIVPPGAPFVRALSTSGELIAIGELRYPNVYQPKIVF